MAARPQLEAVLHDAAGQAALLAVEALILKLIEKNVLSADEAIEAIELCLETKRSLAEEGKHPEVAATAATMLSVMSNSLGGARPPIDRLAERQVDEGMAEAKAVQDAAR